MVSDNKRVQDSPIKTSYLFINPFTIDHTHEYVDKLCYQAVDCEGEEICYVSDPLIYCTIRILQELRPEQIHEVIAYYLVCLSSLPHLDVEWYQLDSLTDEKTSFVAFLSNLTREVTGKSVYSCSIIPMFSKNSDVGYMHHCSNPPHEKQGFIYRSDAVDTISEIIKEFSINEGEIKAIVDFQEETNNLPKYFHPQYVPNTYEL